MCGIAGYVALSGHPDFSVWSMLERMQYALEHRGPDGKGVFCPNNLVGIAHSRLSIIDTSSAGAQPMWNAYETALISFNGEIYNYQSLKKILESLGHKFVSKTDTEVLLAAYDQWGIKCLDYLEGMFAFIILDLAKDEVFIVRDRIGVKPVFFATDHSTYLACASEIKALWQVRQLQKEPFIKGIEEYLQYLQPVTPHTIYKNIYTLPPAHYIHINAQKKVSYHRWYDVLEHAQRLACPDDKDTEGWISLVDTTLQTAVKSRLISDVPLGVFLSGGLDSSLIAAIMSQHQTNVKTFTLSIEGNDVDEREWAQKVSQQIKSDHYEYHVTSKEYLNTLTTIQLHSDQPLGDPLCAGLSILSEYIKKQGVIVALFGEGADEIFGGYPSYTRYQKLFPLYNTAAKLPMAIKKVINSTLYPLSKKRPLLAHALESLVKNEPLFKTSALGIYNPAKLLNKSKTPINALDFLHIDFQSEYLRLKETLPQSDCLSQLAFGELLHRIPQLLLTRFDQMTMLHGVEGRVPYLDHHLVALSLRIPQSLKIKNGQQKWLLKKVAEKYLSQEIIYRKKVGFVAPLNKLMSQQPIHAQLNSLFLQHDSLGKIFQMHEVRKWIANSQDTSQPALPIWLLCQLASQDMFG